MCPLALEITHTTWWERTKEGNYLLGCLGVLSPSVPLWAFYRRVQPERAPFFFQSTASFRWKCVRFQRTTAALDLPGHQIAPLCLCVCVYSQINTAQHTSICFFWGGLVGGRDRVLHFTPFSTLYIALSQHMRLLRTAECEWESGCERIKICCFIFFLLAYISPVLPARPKHHPRKSSWGFVPSVDIWLVH